MMAPLTLTEKKGLWVSEEDALNLSTTDGSPKLTIKKNHN